MNHSLTGVFSKNYQEVLSYLKIKQKVNVPAGPITGLTARRWYCILMDLTNLGEEDHDKEYCKGPRGEKPANGEFPANIEI